MSDVADLNDLMRRCEEAKRADRGIDQDIYCVLGLAATDPDGLLIAYAAPMYTASIDAAVGLVEKVRPGWCWTVAPWWCEGDETPPYYADVGELPKLKAGDETAICTEARASGPALALCAALLRALASQPHTEDGREDA